ncbi:dienelactone hydrolase family protein [Micromonospora fulviviridis]|uniref:Dienelactone hydrolase family protein n=1 Tax=Micromonospora fulviviridis TaxID=47860 RepID=A0ABV2VW93_9ACTN
MTTLEPVREVVGLTPGAQQHVKQTSADGLDIARISIDVEGFPVPAYTARPGGREGDALPVLLVAGESFGLHPHLEDVTRRLAHEGYLAIAPDLMARQGDPADHPDINDLLATVLHKIPDEQVMNDLDAVRSWAVRHGGDEQRVGFVAFSWGGRWAWLYSARTALAAGVVWYGVLDDSLPGLLPDRSLAPTNPVEIADTIQTPVLGLYAGKDAVIPVSALETVQQALARRPENAPAAELVVYPDTVHGFHADFRDDYDADAAADSWDRALRWLRNHNLGG